MDLLTTIELELKEAMLAIDGGVTVHGYQYNNTVTIVNVDDEAVAVEYGQFPTVSIYLDATEPVTSQNSQAYLNSPKFKLVCDVAIEGSVDVEIPRFEINQKMNELLSDIKAVLHLRNNLNCACNEVLILDSYRTYNTDGDIYRVGQLEVLIQVEYSQSKMNPNAQCPM